MFMQRTFQFCVYLLSLFFEPGKCVCHLHVEVYVYIANHAFSPFRRHYLKGEAARMIRLLNLSVGVTYLMAEVTRGGVTFSWIRQ